ncbi:putative peptidoglycan lipid II flippase MurJ [Candidatus Promineifilum breve]|uniref:Lipid II flippase n=1 Tax=Candidatus Promineifilum breve TaxID=1806508 RepID=A0A160SZN7_9CHLR|nr:murein biosynthesis integral membrane protein MurJ [Candidatus Promineifilum breve]CUS02886.2 putative peptidoglycan lipid II flippase MurJ [Candidatus Promineifilum breve]
MTITAPISASESPALKPPRRVRLGGITALAQSAWMGFPLGSEILEPIRLAPGAVRRWTQVVRPHWPAGGLSLRGLWRREFGIAEASFLLMASFFLSAALGSVRQVLFNAQFGVSMEANAYYAAFRLPDTLFSLVAGGALSSAMIPVLLTTRQDRGESAAWQLVSLVLTALLAFMAVIIVIVGIFTPFFVENLLAPGFDAATSRLTVQLTRIMLIQPLILAVGSVATAVLNSRNQFFPTALSVVSHNIALIIGILASTTIDGLGILGPTLGVIGGATLQLLILLPGLFDRNGHIAMAFNFADERLREVIRLLIPNGLSVGVNYSGFIVDTSFATRAPETAGLAALYNAFLLVGLPIALLGQAVGQAAFPRLTAHAERGEWRPMRRTQFVALGAAVGLALGAVVGLLLLGRPVIRFLFERGAFDAAAGDLTYRVLVIYAVALPAYVATEVITRGLIALRDTRTPLLTNTGQLISRIILISLLIQPWGVVAIPAAFAITSTLETLALGGVLWRKLNRRITVSPATEETTP